MYRRVTFCNDQIPTWLSEALERKNQETIKSEGFTVSDRPSPGDIRVIRPGSLGAGMNRLALVISIDDSTRTARIVLATNETEYACDRDVRVGGTDTHLAFELMIECDLVATVWCSQIDKQVGKLSDSLFDSVVAAVAGNFEGIESSRRGPRIRGPADPRWGYRETELDSLNVLSKECMSRLLDGGNTHENL